MLGVIKDKTLFTCIFVYFRVFNFPVTIETEL